VTHASRLCIASAVAFAAVAAGALADDSTRCASGRIVSVGMVAAEVLARCGEPKSRESQDAPVRTRTPAGGTVVVGTMRIDRWVYSRGQGQFDALFTFEDGKLVDIQLLSTRQSR
jgi:hypothetical protein